MTNPFTALRLFDAPLCGPEILGVANYRRPAHTPSRRELVGGKTYLIQIKDWPEDSDPRPRRAPLVLASRQVNYHSGLRIVNWLRSRGHVAGMH